MISLRTYLKSLHIVNRAVKTQGCRSFASAVTTNEEQIEIPNRIERSSTDILRALSNTVGRDFTAPHYKYHDDPFLIPMSNIGKRTFAMAQESGRKSAKWVRQEHSFLFQHKEADPPIEAFIPTKIFTEESQVDIKDLQQLINEAEITDAVLVYNLLKKNEIEIPAELKQSLFELVCYYNHEDPLSDEFIEERWFRQSNKIKERQRKTWKDHDLAEQLFSEIPKDSKTYSTIIRGMSKFYQVEKAWALYNECIANNIELDVYAFNAIINVASFLKESSELRWDLVVELLTAMNNQKVRPNLGTLNAALYAVGTMGGYRQSRDYALKILAEFKNNLGIEPSLAAYFQILQIFCKERGPVSHVLVDIMNQIEGKEFEIQDPKDTNFFVQAMDVCRNHLNDRNLAKRVDDLLHLGHNYNLIGDSFKESIYYRHYFSLLVSTEPLDVFMETYNSLVPNVYIPEPGVMEDILKAVEVTGAIENLPLLWSHMILFDHINRENLLQLIMQIMIQNKPDETMPTQQNLKEQFGAVAWDIWVKIEDKNEMRSKPIVWTGRMLGGIIRLLARVSEMEKANTVFEKLMNDQQKIIGEPELASMEDFIALAIEHKQPSKAISCLQYCHDIGMTRECRDLAITIVKGFTLDESHSKRIAFLVGNDVLKEANVKIEEIPSN
ncbi:unnamed protein product [Diamesa tonsa]